MCTIGKSIEAKFIAQKQIYHTKNTELRSEVKMSNALPNKYLLPVFPNWYNKHS